jgi:uncharacterized membrane-anchored protein YjiN (DUF445 family)
MLDFNLKDSGRSRHQDLVRMKRLATGLLLAVTVIFISARLGHGIAPWVGYIEATAEAAMIGALADWFAVTALFRHPLGLKIPHTAIIPQRKNQIAEQFGRFVQENFLSEQVISTKIRAMNLSRHVALWLVTPRHADAVAEQLTNGLAGAVRVMNDASVQSMIEQRLVDKIRDTHFAPLIGDLLTFLTSGRRQQEAIDAAVNIALKLLEESGSLTATLYEMQMDVLHPMRIRLINMTDEFLKELKHSTEIRSKEAAIKEDLLNQPALRDFTQSLWYDIKAALLRQSEQPNAELKRTIQQSVMKFGEAILEDPALAHKIDGWAEASAGYLIRTYGHEAADLISGTIDGWDPEATAERIELQIGRDLQFIRINGTLVGGLAGLVIHCLSEASRLSPVSLSGLWPL